MHFRKTSFVEYYSNAFEAIRLKILGEQESFIIGSDTDELTNYYYSTKVLTPIRIDPERSETAEPINEVKIVPAHKREDIYQNEGDLPFEYESLKISMPIIPHPNMKSVLDLRPSTYGLSWSQDDADWKRDRVQFTIVIKGYSIDKKDPEIVQRVQQQKQNISNYLHIVDTEITQHNDNLKQKIKALIAERKQKLIANQEKYSSLLKQINIPLKKKEDEIVTKIQLDTSPIVRHVRPNPVQPEDYIIDREKVTGVIHILDNQGRQFEKTPETYKDFGENDFRNVLLVSLNSVFEGKATGETFNGKGKTDIHLNIAKGDILVCECKIWAGQELYKKTISQLLGYLTWRENFGILITFIRSTKPGKVLKEAAAAIKSHETYDRGFHEIAESHYMSHHHSPIDETRKVEVHHLFYNI
jgi:hypothetical protein